VHRVWWRRSDAPDLLSRVLHHSWAVLDSATTTPALTMATAVFSQHSSNPLEVGSSDRGNREYSKRVQREVEAGLSEDPCNIFSESNLDKYHKHIQQLFPNYTAVRRAGGPGMGALLDLDDDDDMLSVQDGPEDTQYDGDDPEEDTVPEDAEADAEGEPDDGECESDEEISLFLRPPDEREEIEREIAELEEAVPQLDEDYRILDRLGTGTFSSVYKAVDLGYHAKWDNRGWLGRHPSTSSSHYQSVPVSNGTSALVAIKRIYVTSNPERIKNEITIMEDCRSCRHVSQMITAFRNQDQVVIVMPYHRNVDFRVSFWCSPFPPQTFNSVAGLLSTTPDGRHQGLLPMYVPCPPGHTLPEHHPP
jgi:cell division control protein 7